jgi:pimeloyl-ACP methyl ester carboxylesterase
MDEVRRNRTLKAKVVVGVLIALVCLSWERAWAGQVRGPFYGSFQGANQWDHTRCDEASRFVYYMPEGQGPFPLAIFLTGTLGNFDGWEAHLNLQRLAARGYLAASPDYGQNHVFCAFSCYCYSSKADCVSDPDFSGSLVRVLERDTPADTSRGFVTWGHSQGGYVAVLAGDRNARITRALATGTADPSGSYPCMEPGERRLASTKVRFVIGESDEVTPPSQAADTPGSPGFIAQLASLTEQPACAASGAYACLRPDGCGYYIVSNREAGDDTADHRYFLDHDQDGDSPLSLSSRYRTEWGRPWSLDAEVDWLTGACGDGVCSETESVLTCDLDC